MEIKFDTSEFDPIVEKFAKRASDMVQEALDEGRRRADDYAASGGRHAKDQKRRYSSYGRRTRRRGATGAQTASMCEKVFYKRLVDFWGDW